MKISLFPFSGADADATRSPTPTKRMDLDEGSQMQVSKSPCQCSLCSCELPPTPTGPSDLNSPSSPGSSNPPNSPNCYLSSQEAPLQVTWWGVLQESMTARAWNPRPHCHFAWLDHMEVSSITRPWAPSQLVVWDAQHFILQAEREKHNIMMLWEWVGKYDLCCNHPTLQDISAINGGYTFINMYLMIKHWFPYKVEIDFVYNFLV